MLELLPTMLMLLVAVVDAFSAIVDIVEDDVADDADGIYNMHVFVLV
jgi:hypothetical protein